MTDPFARFIFVDIETFGLVPATDPILELGFAITDRDLRIVDVFEATCWDNAWYPGRYVDLINAAEEGDKGAKIVLDMHEKSKLWENAPEDGQPMEVVKVAALAWLEAHEVGRQDPMCGSSVGSLDRPELSMWMPEVNETFSYRSIDISSIKELCRREAPEVYSKLDQGKSSKRDTHRVIEDIEDTINEYRFYRDNFLRIER